MNPPNSTFSSQDFLLNPLLFIRGLSCPSCLLVSCGDIGFKKNPRSSIGLEMRPQSAFSAFMGFLPSANYSAEWSGRVWQPSANSNGLLEHHYCQQRAVTPDPESLNLKKKGAKLPVLSAEGLHTRLDGLHCPLISYKCVFFKGEETLGWYK